MASRLPLGRQTFNYVLKGISNPLKGLVPIWDDPIQFKDDVAYIAYNSTPQRYIPGELKASGVQEDATESIFPDEEFSDDKDEPIDLGLEGDELASVVEEDEKIKTTPYCNNRFVKIKFALKKNTEISLPKAFAVNPLVFFNWSKIKFFDADVPTDTECLSFALKDSSGRTVQNLSMKPFNQTCFNRHKKRFNQAFEKLSSSKAIKQLAHKVELKEDDVEALLSKHCLIIYEPKNNTFKVSSEAITFTPGYPYQLRLDKNLLPKFSKADKTHVTIDLYDRQEPDIPHVFTLVMNLDSKLFTAKVLITALYYETL